MRDILFVLDLGPHLVLATLEEEGVQKVADEVVAGECGIFRLKFAPLDIWVRILTRSDWRIILPLGYERP